MTLPLPAELDGGVVGAAAARADEPLALAAQVDELGRESRRGWLTAIVASAAATTRLEEELSPAARGMLPQTTMSMPRRRWCGEFLLEAEDGGLDILRPVAAGVAHHLAAPCRC